MKTLFPTETQMVEFANAPDKGPFVMINLLKFKNTQKNGLKTGLETYNRYGEQVMPLLEKVGAKIIWLGSIDQVFIGTSVDEWDQLILIEYPSRKAFTEMISMPEYSKANRDREVALEATTLLTSSSIFTVLGKNN